MLNLVDDLIVRVLDTGWTTSGQPPKPSFYFTVPDDDWRKKVANGPAMRLNVYLYEVRENRTFRRAEWDPTALPDRTVALSAPPVYLDCHYLISAWSATEDSELTQPVRDEHFALAEATRVLLRNPDVSPSALGIAGGGPVFQNAHVYLTVAPPESPRVLNDFWSTMKLAWRPAIMLVVTAPLDLNQDAPPAPLVTTLIQRYGELGTPQIEEWIQIGGFVLRAADQTPLVGATVTRLANGDVSTTDAQGRYAFAGLRRGVQRFRASAAGMQSLERDIDVPADPPTTLVFALSP
jgi:hypothetical protein